MKKGLPFILMLTFIACSKKDTNEPNTDPSTLTAYVGDTITIEGKNLGTDPRTLMVQFGTVHADVISVSETSAKVIVPDDMVESNVKIHLFATTNEFTSNFKLKAPVIQSVSPGEGFSGQQVVITGKGFSKSRQVAFGNKLLNTYYQSNNSFSIKVPDSIATGKYAISMTVAGLKASAPELFNVVPFIAPTFTGFSPQTAFIGDTITLEGEHFGTNADGLGVGIGNAEATIVSVSETAIKVVIPDEIEEASAKIHLSVGLTTELTSTNNFQLKAPVINSIDVTSGFSGQFINIYGKGFRKSNKTDQVVFGDAFIEARQTTSEHSEISISVPNRLAAGKYPVKVTVAGMTATAPDSYELFVPTITSFTPHSAGMFGKMTITGTNLKNINPGVGTSIFFEDFETGRGSYIAHISSNTGNEINLALPDYLVSGKTYRIIITVLSGIVETTEPFTYVE